MSDLLPAIPGDVPGEPAHATYEDITIRGDRKPLVAEKWQRRNLKATVRQDAGLHWHKTRYHAYRPHIYGTRTVFYAARGAHRLTVRLLRWWHFTDGYELVSVAVAAGGARTATRWPRTGQPSRHGRPAAGTSHCGLSPSSPPCW